MPDNYLHTLQKYTRHISILTAKTPARFPLQTKVAGSHDREYLRNSASVERFNPADVQTLLFTRHEAYYPIGRSKISTAPGRAGLAGLAGRLTGQRAAHGVK